MAETIKREVCPTCQKRNLCTFKNTRGVDTTKCKTTNEDGSKCPGKQEVYKPINQKQPIAQEQSVTQEQYIDSSTVRFEVPESYRGISSKTLELGRCSVARIGSTVCTQYVFKNLDGTETTKTGFRPESGKKMFKWENKTPETNMYLLDLCKDYTRPLFICEGNEDALTLLELGYQACTIHAAECALECVQNDIEEINKFPSVYICIEDDKAGRGAKVNIKKLLGHKVMYEVSLKERKDANEYLRDDIEGQEPDVQQLLQNIQNAVEIVPKGVIFGDQIDFVELRKPLPKGIYTGFNQVDKMIKGGCLPGDLWLWTAGVSVGKSTVIRKLCSNYMKIGLRVANIFVEESSQVSKLNYIAEELGYPIGEVLIDPTIIPEYAWDKACQDILNNNNLMFIDETWERTSDNLLKTIEYLAIAKKYDIIILDHITAILNSSGVGKGGKTHDIDWFMEQLFNLCRKTGVRVHAISHLKRPSQAPYWDEGRRPSMYDLRGSGSLEGKPDVIISLVRNMRNEYNVDSLELEVLKNRWFSQLGKADEFVYIKSTGRLQTK
jgi:archaellum biogenesis ATPase FlaH